MRCVIERFPPVPQLILVSLLVISGYTMSATVWLGDAGAPRAPLPASTLLLTLVGGALFIFHLRLFDDVKDAETDRIIAPSRPIPRGLVSEREMDAFAAILIMVQGIAFAAVGPMAFLLWAVAAGYTVLMRVEFFVGSWLDRHVLTYATSHMVVMGLVLAALVGAGIESMELQQVSLRDAIEDPRMFGACAAAVLLGIGFEIGRKFERYERVHGMRAWALLAILPASGALMMLVSVGSEYPMWVGVLCATVVAASCVGGLLLARARPAGTPDTWGEHPRAREVVEAFPGLAGLLVYLALAIHGLGAVSWQ
jgi:4-hydroxybenzoate polyprenyltransferase